MSILTALKTPYSLEDAFKAKDCTSQATRKAINEWFKLYYDREATKDFDPCQRIANTVVNKLTKTCFGEYKATSKDEYAQLVLDAMDARKRSKAMQMLMVGGEVYIKPFPLAQRWGMSIIRRDNVLVFGRDAENQPVDIGTTEQTVDGSRYYTLLERRTVGPDGRLTIRNRLYSSENSGGIGQPVSLQSLARYADLPDEYTYSVPLGGLGLVHMRMPTENTVDGSPDGVSVYAAAVGLIHNIDRNEAQINGEFERGESRIIVPEGMLRNSESGKRGLHDNVFVGAPMLPEDQNITIFSPQLREESFLNRKREYLRNVESVIGIKRGLLSEVEAQERTAKEVTSSEGDYNLTIIDLQEVWTQAVKDTVKLCGILGKLYKVPGAHEVDEDAVSIDWGNGVLYDEDKTWADYLDMVARGLLKPEIAIGWRFGMPTETEKDLAAIRAKYMPELEQLVDGGEE